MATKRKTTKATKAKATKARRLDGEAKIKVLVDNPYREGSLGSKVFARYKHGMTVAAFERTGKIRGSERTPRQFLLFDVKQRHVSVG
jgi:hypothetical protein